LNSVPYFLALFSPGKDTIVISAIQTVKLPAHGLFRLSAELNAKNITVLPETWHGGRLLLISLSAEGKPLYKNPHVFWIIHQMTSNGKLLNYDRLQ